MIIHQEERVGKPFVMVDKSVLIDRRLSFKAKGLLTYLLSRPQNWKTCAEHLASISTDGVDAIYSALKELRVTGYADYASGGVGGGSKWTVRETPRTPQGGETGKIPDPGNPGPGKTGTNNNTSMLNTSVTVAGSQETNNETTSNNGAARRVFIPPTLEELLAFAKSIHMPSQEAEACFNYYESNGWKVGKNKMIKWRASVKGWHLRSESGVYQRKQSQSKQQEFPGPWNEE